MLFRSLVAHTLSVTSLLIGDAHALLPRQKETQSLVTRQVEPNRSSSNSYEYSNSSFRFYNEKTAPYLIKSLPDFPLNLGEIYSGNIPVNLNDTTRQLFFVFQPTTGKPVDEITIWFQGGPGCSSLQGFIKENGRFTWQPGTFAPVENPYSWTNLTNMLWVDQPIGSGFSIGTPRAKTEEYAAQEFLRAFKNFQKLFGIKKFKIYVTGESYAGRYVPYFSAAMLDEDDKEYYDVRGALVYDAAIGSYMPIQHNTPLVPFVVANNNILNLNSSYIAQLQELHSSCGYADYLQKYLQFPPPGIQPLAKPSWSDGNCNLFVPVNTAAYQVNPCFSQYAINMQCPIPWDVISLPTAFPYTPAGATVYFDRADVKAAMHAPNITWSACSPGDVFIGNASGMSFNDESVDSIQHALPRVIEATNRVLVGNGDYDMQITTNGTLLAIQNMTWNGMLGFQSTPSTPVDIQVPELVYGGLLTDSGTGSIGGQGIMGIQHYERGLMWAQTFQATHMLPMSQPRSAYRHLQWLLGHTETL